MGVEGVLLPYHEVAELVEHTGAGDGIDTVAGMVAAGDFVEVETDELPARGFELAEEVEYLLCLETTGNGCTCVGTQLGVEPVYIETDVYLLRQCCNNVVANGFPGIALVFAGFDVAVEEGDHTAIALIYDIELLIAIVANAHLHQLADLRNGMEHIVHDRRMRIGEALVSIAEVGMGIDLQHTKIGVYL